MKVSALYVYPVKSLGGILLETSEVEERGLKYDRRWMLVNDKNELVTQRTHVKMSLLKVAIQENGLLISHLENEATFLIPFELQTAERLTVTVWDDSLEAIRVSDEADAWFSAQINTDCRLVYQPDDSVRPTDERFKVTGNEHVSMADGYPILMISEASLGDLNSRLESPVEMLRFRPNIVASDCEAFAEDDIRKMTVNGVELCGVKPCARCVMTTIKPGTTEKGSEPLKTLAAYRKVGNKILFGQNVLVHKTGKISVGDEVVLT
jgi:hypothetical protein